jgi:hypothetical protein
MLLSMSGCAPDIPIAQLTFRVADDEGKPVPNAVVAVLGIPGESQGLTDQQGQFTANLRNAKSAVEIVVEKKGYYSISRHIFEFVDGDANGYWQPQNSELSFLLARKRNPVVLKENFVHGVDIPVIGHPVGYDVVVGDWVAPAGKGLVRDFILLAQTTITDGSVTSNRLILSFSNPSDGLIRTNIHWRNDYTLRLPPMAPEAGYSNRWDLYLIETRDPNTRILHSHSNWGKDDNYYFRVRTQTNPDGRVLAGIYGKIYQGILYGPARGPDELPSITFHYYLNPDGTRNLESKGERPDNDDP